MKKIFEKVRYILRRVGKKACSVLLILAILLGCASFGIYKENKTSKAFFVVDDATVIATLLTCALGGVAAGATYNYMTASPSEIGLNTSNKDETLAYIHECFSGNDDFKHVVSSAEMMYTFERAVADVLSVMPNSVAIPRKETYQKLWKLLADNMTDGTSAVNMDSMIRQVKSATILKFPNTNNDDDDDDEKTDEEQAEEEANTSEDLGEALENDKVILPSTFLDLVPTLALSTLICKGVAELLSEEFGDLTKIDSSSIFGTCDYSLKYFKENPFIFIEYFDSTYKYPDSIGIRGFGFGTSKLCENNPIFTDDFMIKNDDLRIYPCFYQNGTHGRNNLPNYYLRLVTNREVNITPDSNGSFGPICLSIYTTYYNWITKNVVNSSYSNDRDQRSNIFQFGKDISYLSRYYYDELTNMISSRSILENGYGQLTNCYFLPSEECVDAFQDRIREYGCIDTKNIDSLYEITKQDWWRYHSNTRTDPSQRDKSKDNDMSSEGKGTDKDGNTRHTKGIDPEKVNNGMHSGLYNEEETTGKKPTYTHGQATPDNHGVIVGESGQNGRYMTYDEIMALINEQIARNPNPYGDPNYDPAKDVQPEKDPQATTKPNQPTATPPKNTTAPTSTPITKDENFPDINPILPSGDSEGIAWYERFPFCIPFDIAHTVEKLNAQAKPPSFVVPYTVKSLNYTQNVEVKLEDDTWEKVRNITRWFILIIFVVGLAILTRTIIRG